MNDVIISVDKLGKSYWLKHQAGSGLRKGAKYETFGETLSNVLKAPFRPWGKTGGSDASREEFWALKDVSFEVKRGEVLGIIGRNGAGKSTLLKILARITEPAKGRVEIDGRVASLLEVGTGFHPELSGRENIFLNGAILGMTRVEIKRKFDEIVAFAEVEKFLDTPVKRYSSGMYVRLAFAVAAHLEPEILIVDEVLAVGDAEFQKKCLGKMKDVSSQEGRTVIFVSHNLTAVASLCERVLYLNAGQVAAIGEVGPIVEQYLESTRREQHQLRESDKTILNKAELVGLEWNPSAPGWLLTFAVTLSNKPRPSTIGIDFIIRHSETAFAFGSSAYFSPVKIGPATRRLRCVVGPLNLAVGSYEIDLRVCEPMQRWLEEHDAALQFSIALQPGSTQLFQLNANRNLGVIIAPQAWTVLP